MLKRGDALRQKVASELQELIAKGYRRKVDPITGNYVVVDPDGKPYTGGVVGVPIDKKGKLIYRGKRESMIWHDLIGNMPEYKPKKTDTNNSNTDGNVKSDQTKTNETDNTDKTGNPDETGGLDETEDPDDTNKTETPGNTDNTDNTEDTGDVEETEEVDNGTAAPTAGTVPTGTVPSAAVAADPYADIKGWSPYYNFWESVRGDWIEAGPEGSVINNAVDFAKIATTPWTQLAGWDKYILEYPYRNYDLGWGEWLYASPEEKEKRAKEVERKTKLYNQKYGIKRRGGKLVPRPKTNRYA